jgi:surface antigen
VLACGDREAVRWALYSGIRGLRLRRPSHFLASVAAILGAFSAGGCAYQLETTYSKAEADVEQTGSIARTSQRTADAVTTSATSATSVPSETDLAYARAAAADVLARGSKDTSVPWENPNTGAGGNITPLAAHNEGSSACRDFLASYVLGQAQAWLEGEACRTERGRWEVKRLKPLKQG